MGRRPRRPRSLENWWKGHERLAVSTLSASHAQKEVHFAHPSEEEFSCILDFYRIEWEYEPRSFTLDRDEGGNVTEAFTPDFYLPQQELYVEITTMRQELVTRKNRKLRRVRELYPGIQIKLFYRRDFARLLDKYGLSTERGELIGRAALE